MGADAIVRGRQICLLKMPEALQRNIREALQRNIRKALQRDIREALQRNIRQAFPTANNGIFVLESEGAKKV